MISCAAKTPRTGAQQRVAVEALEVARELLHPVDLAPPLDLDRDVAAVGVAAQQVDRADVGGVLASYELPTGAEHLTAVGQQLLQMRLDAVLLQARVDAEVVAVSLSTSSTVMTSCSPPLFVTVQRSSSTRSEHGGDIHISGL